jgi:CheY-like chemotaxis protein
MDASGPDVPPSPPSPAEAGPAGGLCSGLDFLVVEDHEFQRAMLLRTLRRLGAADVRGFAAGADALAAARQLQAPGTILVLDLGLPALGGIDIARIAGQERLAVAIILHSAQPDAVLNARVAEARSGGAVVLGGLGKPLTESRLAPLIAEHRRQVAAGAGAPGPR